MPPPAFSVCVFVGLCCMCLKALHPEVLLFLFCSMLSCCSVYCDVLFSCSYDIYASRISLFSRGYF